MSEKELALTNLNFLKTVEANVCQHSASGDIKKGSLVDINKEIQVSLSKMDLPYDISLEHTILTHSMFIFSVIHYNQKLCRNEFFLGVIIFNSFSTILKLPSSVSSSTFSYDMLVIGMANGSIAIISISELKLLNKKEVDCLLNFIEESNKEDNNLSIKLVMVKENGLVYSWSDKAMTSWISDGLKKPKLVLYHQWADIFISSASHISASDSIIWNSDRYWLLEDFLTDPGEKANETIIENKISYAITYLNELIIIGYESGEICIMHPLANGIALKANGLRGRVVSIWPFVYKVNSKNKKRTRKIEGPTSFVVLTDGMIFYHISIDTNFQLVISSQIELASVLLETNSSVSISSVQNMTICAYQ